MKKLLCIAPLLFSAQSFAGDWYDDWLFEEVTTRIDTPYYGGSKTCHTPNGDWLSLYKSKTYVSTHTVYKDLNKFDLFDSCTVTFPQIGVDTTYKTKTVKSPIQPYANNVFIERLACSGSQRKVLISVANAETAASSMQIFASPSPYYADNSIYSGSSRAHILTYVNANADTINFRIKLDDGSSYYASGSNMKCTGGGGVPLD